MTLDKDTLRPRRAILAAALGGVAATVATAVARPDVVRAGSGRRRRPGGAQHHCGSDDDQLHRGDGLPLSAGQDWRFTFGSRSGLYGVTRSPSDMA